MGAQIGAGAEPPGPPHFNHYNKTVCNAVWAGQQGSETNTNKITVHFENF